MSSIDRLLGPITRSAHPRLLTLVVLGAAIGVLGTALSLAGPGPGELRGLGTRLAVVGYLVFLLGASGYVAFAVFERGFD